MYFSAKLKEQTAAQPSITLNVRNATAVACLVVRHTTENQIPSEARKAAKQNQQTMKERMPTRCMLPVQRPAHQTTPQRPIDEEFLPQHRPIGQDGHKTPTRT